MLDFAIRQKLQNLFSMKRYEAIKKKDPDSKKKLPDKIEY